MNAQEADMLAKQAALAMASDEQKAALLAQQEANAKTACLCTIQNPGKRRQVIYDGITNASPIMFEPGETKAGVRLAEHMVVRLQDDENAHVKGSDGQFMVEEDNPNLRVLDWKTAPPETARPIPPPRKPRPARASPVSTAAA